MNVTCAKCLSAYDPLKRLMVCPHELLPTDRASILEDFKIPIGSKLRGRWLFYKVCVANSHILFPLFLRNSWSGFLRIFRL
jgi:hypothetical protein